MPKITVTETEQKLLKDYKRKAPEVLVQAKAEAILLIAKNVAIDIVADFVDRKPSTVKEWLHQWNISRMGSVVTGHCGNLNASKLTAEQRDQAAAVLQLPPGEQGLPGGFWSVPSLKSWLSTKFSVIYESTTSYHFLLRFAGLSFHEPQPFDQRRGTEAVIEARLAAIREEIAPALEDPQHLVFASDETRLVHEAITRRAWCQRGAKTKLTVDRERQAQNYIGFLDLQSGDCDLHALHWQNSGTIIEALTNLLTDHPRKKITIIWDNASWHRSKELRAHLGPGNLFERLHLIWMPPYSPDHNPIEHVWKDGKDHIANLQRNTFDETCLAFEHHISQRQYHYRL